jgi:hypothetical protein
MKLTGLALVVVAVLLASAASAGSAPGGHDCGWSSAGRLATRGVIHSDVDADGRPDTVAVVGRYGAAPGCRLALRVQLGTGITLFHPLAETPNATGDDLREQPWPRLVSLVKIDPRPGLQPVVSVQLGASTVFVDVFAIHGGQLVRLTAPESAFAAGASGVASAVDCWHGAGSGEVVSSFAQSNIHGWAVSRSLYRLAGNSFRPPTTLPPVRVKYLSVLPEFHGPGLGIFPNCTVAQSRFP